MKKSVQFGNGSIFETLASCLAWGSDPGTFGPTRIKVPLQEQELHADAVLSDRRQQNPEHKHATCNRLRNPNHWGHAEEAGQLDLSVRSQPVTTSEQVLGIIEANGKRRYTERRFVPWDTVSALCRIEGVNYAALRRRLMRNGCGGEKGVSIEGLVRSNMIRRAGAKRVKNSKPITRRKMLKAA